MKIMWKKVLKTVFIFSLVISLIVGQADAALAARSGGRIGGGSFSAPSRSYSMPSRGYSGGGGYGYGGGGFGFPFLIPFLGFGGGFGGLFTVLIFFAIANFLFRSFQNIAGSDDVSALGSSKVSVAKVQVGLLASARELQPELDQLAEKADTSTVVGRVMVLQEASLALLRHPEYWAYGSTESSQNNLETAEAKFNQLSLMERSKFSEETLTNFNAQIRKTETSTSLVKEAGEYILVTIIVGVTGKLELPQINGFDELKTALNQIASVGGDRLLAVEVLWTPQAAGDTLTTDDILAQYPNLKLV
jgi:uncharacterized membrane protein